MYEKESNFIKKISGLSVIMIPIFKKIQLSYRFYLPGRLFRSHNSSVYDSQSGTYINIPNPNIVYPHLWIESGSSRTIADFIKFKISSVVIKHKLTDNIEQGTGNSPLVFLFGECNVSLNESDRFITAINMEKLAVKMFKIGIAATITVDGNLNEAMQLNSRKSVAGTLQFFNTVKKSFSRPTRLLLNVQNLNDIYDIESLVAEIIDSNDVDSVFLRFVTEIEEDQLRDVIERLLNLDVFGDPMKQRLGFLGNFNMSSIAIESGIVNIGFSNGLMRSKNFLMDEHEIIELVQTHNKRLP